MIRIHFSEDQLQLAIEALKAVVEDCPDADWNRDVQALTDRLDARLVHYQNRYPF